MLNIDERLYVKKYTKTPDDPLVFKVNEREVWRYCGYFGPLDDKKDELGRLYDDAGAETAKALSYSLCYRTLPVSELKPGGALEFLTVSKQVVKLLDGCSHVVLFAATAGIGIDRAIGRWQKISPTMALLMQGFGAERVEALCDDFCSGYRNTILGIDDMNKGEATVNTVATPRFSPGYGDLPIETQQNFFTILDISHLLGISLGEGCFMKPSKSVTALFGIKEVSSEELLRLEKCGESIPRHDCSMCSKTDCELRA